MRHVIGLELVKEYNNDNRSFDLLVDIFVKNTCLLFGDKMSYCGQCMTKHCYVVNFEVDDRYDVDMYEYVEKLVDGFNVLGINIKYDIKKLS